MNIPKDTWLPAEIADFAGQLASDGDPVVVGNVKTTALWSPVSSGSAGQYIKDDSWDVQVLRVDFSDPTLAKRLLALGTEITWTSMGWKGVTRHLEPDYMDGSLVGFAAVVVVIPMLILPFSVTVQGLTQATDASTLADKVPTYATVATINCNIKAVKSQVAYDMFGVEATRAHMLVGSVPDMANIAIGNRVVFGTRTFAILTAPKRFYLGTENDHFETVIDELEFA